IKHFTNVFTGWFDQFWMCGVDGPLNFFDFRFFAHSSSFTYFSHLFVVQHTYNVNYHLKYIEPCLQAMPTFWKLTFDQPYKLLDVQFQFDNMGKRFREFDKNLLSSPILQ